MLLIVVLMANNFKATAKVGVKTTTYNNNIDNDDDDDDDDDINFEGGIVGVLTIPQNYHLRNMARLTWMKDESIENHHQVQEPKRRIRTFFVLDYETPELLLEQQLFGDLVFVNNTYAGYADHFGEKLYNWFTYANRRFPNAVFVAKMDDDVAFCPTTTTTTTTTAATKMSKKTAYIWDFIYELQPSPMLYLGGYMHDYRSGLQKSHQNRTWPRISGDNYRIDEMFVVVGNELIQRLTQRQYCNPDKINQLSCKKQNGLWDTNYGGTSLGQWLEPYNEFGNMTIVPLNHRSVHYGRGQPHPKASKQICMEGKILYHKADIHQMDAIWGSTKASTV